MNFKKETRFQYVLNILGNQLPNVENGEKCSGRTCRLYSSERTDRQLALARHTNLQITRATLDRRPDIRTPNSLIKSSPSDLTSACTRTHNFL
jgi:hypothetical protein